MKLFLTIYLAVVLGLLTFRIIDHYMDYNIKSRLKEIVNKLCGK